jgi:hypothetical protein
MAITGVEMQLKAKKQSALGTIATASSAQLLRRVQSTLNLDKQTYQSAEIRPDFQVADCRHGVRSVGGSISGELSPGSYSAFMESVLRRAFTTVTAATGLGLTIAGTGPTYTVTRGAGSFLTDGFKVGHVIRLTVGSLNAANINKNLMIVTLTATVATVVVLNGSVMAAEGPITGCTVTVQGRQTFCPQTSHTNDFWSIEHWYPTLSPTASETFWDCKIAGMNVSLPPTGMANVEFPVMGLDLQTQVAEYFTSPTAATTSGIVAAVNGVLRSSSGALANITGLSFNVTNGNQMAGPVVGLNKGVDIVNGRHQVSGQLTALFDSVTLRDQFINETELGLYVAMTTDNTATAAFVAFSIDRIKLGAATRDDGEGVKSVTVPFTALLNSAGGAGIATENTTLRVQDSAA